MALTTNLVSYYKCDESSWNLADSSWNGYNATNANTTYSTWKINNWVVFNWSSAKATITWMAWAFSTDAITVAFRAKTRSGIKPAIFCNWALNRYIWYPINSILIEWAVPNTLDYTASLPDANWHYVLCTYDKNWWTNNQKIFYDWVLRAQQTLTVSMATTAANTVLWNFSTYWQSDSMDEIWIWSRAVTDWWVSLNQTAWWEVAQLYNSWNWLAYPWVTTNIKSINWLAYSSIKSVNGLSIASMKSLNWLS